jgi:hypothetical protein
MAYMLLQAMAYMLLQTTELPAHARVVHMHVHVMPMLRVRCCCRQCRTCPCSER